jgi:hypothetical protein
VSETADPSGQNRQLETPQNTHRYYVVVTLGGVSPEVTAPREYFEKGLLPDEVFPIFHYPVPMGELPKRLISPCSCVFDVDNEW